MGTAFGFILSDDKKMDLRDKFDKPCPHCYFCGSPYVRIIKGEEGLVKVTCLICDRISFVEHGYNDVL